jgi:hypothetical protein
MRRNGVPSDFSESEAPWSEYARYRPDEFWADHDLMLLSLESPAIYTAAVQAMDLGRLDMIIEQLEHRFKDGADCDFYPEAFEKMPIQGIMRRISELAKFRGGWSKLGPDDLIYMCIHQTAMPISTTPMDGVSFRQAVEQRLWLIDLFASRVGGKPEIPPMKFKQNGRHRGR